MKYIEQFILYVNLPILVYFSYIIDMHLAMLYVTNIIFNIGQIFYAFGWILHTSTDLQSFTYKIKYLEKIK